MFLKTYANLTGKHMCWSLFSCEILPSDSVYRFTAYSCGNETYKRLAHLLDRTVCLFRQQEIRERVGNKGREDLYLTIRFIMKIKRNIFIKQLLTNC